MKASELSIDDFSYELPEERIAKFPLEKRDESKLLYFSDGEIADYSFKKLPDLLNEGDLLIANQTRVVQARLIFKTKSGAGVEVFCLEPAEVGLDIQQAMLSSHSILWKCMIGNAKKWKNEEVLLMKDEGSEFNLKAQLISKEESTFIVRFTWEPADISFAEVLEICGKIPLPPYLKREAIEADKERYQTVYAKEKGSVAAPTAGLHFTDDILKRLSDKGIKQAYLTLHVGAGTFKPVKADKMKDHEMHSEEVIASIHLIKEIKDSQGKIIAIGTTSLRSLESLYWTAVQLMRGDTKELRINLNQWYPYEVPLDEQPDVKDAFQFLYDKLTEAKVSYITGHTQLIIAPGYTIKTADVLITNFHQPKSTLLLLASSCISDAWVEVYKHALRNNYRFLSYGDSSFLRIKK